MTEKASMAVQVRMTGSVPTVRIAAREHRPGPVRMAGMAELVHIVELVRTTELIRMGKLVGTIELVGLFEGAPGDGLVV